MSWGLALVTNNNNGFHEEDTVKQPVDAAVSALQGQELEGILAPAIQRMVVQCSALLRQQLERMVKREPLVYSESRVVRIMREFEAVTEDIQDTIASRVKDRLLQLVLQEVRRAFDDALSNAEDSLVDSVWNRGLHRAPLATEDQARSRLRGQGSGEVDGARPDEGTSMEEPPAERAVEVREAAESVPVAVQVRPLEADDVSKGDSQPSAEDEVYEGTVRLNVEANICVRRMLGFLGELHQKSQLRLLQLVGDHKKGVDIWLGLKEPLCLKKTLLDIEGVSQVSAPLERSPNGHERLLIVRLKEDSVVEEA